MGGVAHQLDHVLAVEEAVAQVTAEAAAIGQYALDPDNVYEEFYDKHVLFLILIWLYANILHILL